MLVFIQANPSVPSTGMYELQVNPATHEFVLYLGVYCDYGWNPLGNPLCTTGVSGAVCSGLGAMVVGGAVMIPASKCLSGLFLLSVARTHREE
jgi:hypothetical protein